MRVLLTGSSGWLGRFLAPRLRAAGHVVIGLDVATGADTQVVGSVADRAMVERTFSNHGIEAVIHAGALHKPDIARYPRSATLMISQEIRQETDTAALWLDETLGPLAPRNIYGVTKLAAEGLCRIHFLEYGLNCVVLRTGRFFPEEDDTHRELSGPNLKANEFLNRRLAVEDAADAHVVALDRAPALGFEIFLLSAPTPFVPSDAQELKRAAAKVIERHFPDAPALYARRGWRLPTSIGRVYDAGRIEHILGFRCATDFSRVLDALRSDGKLPFAHEPA